MYKRKAEEEVEAEEAEEQDFLDEIIAERTNSLSE